MRRIRKVKIDKTGKIYIMWEVNIDGKTMGWDEYAMKCSDLPLPSFSKAIARLAADVIYLCELPEVAEKTITVRSVSFSYSEDGVQGAVISAQRELIRSVQPLNLNTPHKPYQPYNQEQGEADPDMLMPDNIIEHLNEVEDEAQRYIDGDRAQGSLFEKKDE